MSTIENNIIDIDLSALRKKRIRIDGDDNKIIELNTSDMGVMERLQSAYSQLIELANSYHFTEEETQDDTDSMISALAEIDKKMCELVDYIFNAKIAEICSSDGTMADPFNGQFRFEYIIGKFLALYDENFTQEFKKMSKNVKKHTDKYTGRK